GRTRGRADGPGAAVHDAARAAVGFLDRIGQRLSSLVDDVTLSDEARARLELAAALADRGDLALAAGELQAVLEEQPRGRRGWRLLGLVRERMGDGAGAAMAFERSGEPEALVDAAGLYRRLGEAGAAMDALQRALAQAPTGPVAAMALRAIGELHL